MTRLEQPLTMKDIASVAISALIRNTVVTTQFASPISKPAPIPSRIAVTGSSSARDDERGGRGRAPPPARSVRPWCRRRRGTPARSAPASGVPRFHSSQNASSASSNSCRAAVALGVRARGDRRPVVGLEVLPVVAGLLERGDLEGLALERVQRPRGRRGALADAPRRPRAAATARRAGAAGANGFIVRNSAPSMPSGVQLRRPIVPPGRQTRTSSSAASWWCGANITPIADMTTSKDSSSNGQVLGVGLDPVELEALRLRALAARLEQRRGQVAGGDVGAAPRGGQRGVAGPGRDVEHAHPGADAASPRRAARPRAAGTSRPSAGSRRRPTSRGGAP